MARYVHRVTLVVGRIEHAAPWEIQVVNDKVNGPDKPREQT
jgi:hypothetical protein